MKPIFLILFSFLLCFLVVSCGPDDRNKEAVAELVDKNVKEKIDEYTNVQIKNCREKILEEANRIVDSILILEARLALDTLAKPPKPERPEMPELKMLEDSQKVEPFFKKDSIQGNQK